MPKKMARGTVWLMGAQVAFLLSGYIIHFGLGRALGPAEYGTFGVILSLLAIVRIFVQRGVPQAVSKYVAEGRNISSIKRNAILIQSIVILICFIIIFVFAPFISFLLGDMSLTPYIRFMAFLIPLSGIFQIYISIINGRRWFGKQALIMILYSALRPVFVFLFVLIGLAIFGAIGGFIVAVAGVLLLSSYIAKKGDESDSIRSVGRREMLLFFLPLMIFSVGITSIRSMDMLFVKALITDPDLVGYYTSAWAISVLPLTVFSALSLTILPSVSSSTAKKDIELTRSYIKNSVRYSFMILLPIALLISASPGELLGFFYLPKFAAAGGALRILIIGMVLFTFFTLFNTTIIAMGKPKIPMIIVFVLLPIDVILNYELIPSYGLEGAALATTLTSFIGACLSGLYIYNKIGGIVDGVSCLKLLAASLVIFSIALFISFSGLLLIILYIVLIVGYLGLLWIIREIKEDDIRLVKDVYRFKK